MAGRVKWLGWALVAWVVLSMWAGMAWAYDADHVAALTIALEARGESYEGQVAVGEVIRNRAKKGHYKGVEAVCLAPYQFSCWNGAKGLKWAENEVSSQEYQRASRAWAESEGSNLTNGARHYHNQSVAPNWARGKVGHRIGAHVFYRGIK